MANNPIGYTVGEVFFKESFKAKLQYSTADGFFELAYLGRDHSSFRVKFKEFAPSLVRDEIFTFHVISENNPFVIRILGRAFEISSVSNEFLTVSKTQ